MWVNLFSTSPGITFPVEYLPIEFCLSQLVEYLETIESKGESKMTCVDLIGQSSANPISDGLSCLAAVPRQAWHLVPEPYSWLVEPSRRDSFEELYNSCFHPTTSTFDLSKFETLCNAEVSRIRNSRVNGANGKQKGVTPGKEKTDGRRIYVGNKHWTVISLSRIPLEHPFEPPKPFAERVRPLRRNKRIRATKLPVKTHVRRIGSATSTSSSTYDDSGESGNDSIHAIPYNTAFSSSNDR